MKITRREFLKLGGSAVVFLSFAAGRASADEMKIPVLMYHDISLRGNEKETLSPQLFAAQMEWLYGIGYRAVSLSELASLHPDSAKQTLVITFDDGYTSFIDYAFPLLDEYGFKATVNVIGEHMGGYVSGNDPRLSWDECRFLAGSGLVEIGCHTYGLHTRYGRQLRSQATDVLNEKLIEDLAIFQKMAVQELGRPVDVLAWPYGMHNKLSIEIARKAGIRFILNSEDGYFATNGDQFEIPRLAINNDTTLRQFRERIEMRQLK